MIGAFPTLVPPGPKTKARQQLNESSKLQNETFMKERLPSLSLSASSMNSEEIFDPVESPYIENLKADNKNNKEGRGKKSPKKKKKKLTLEQQEEEAALEALDSARRNKKRRRATKKPPNYIGAGRPVSPAAVRAAPDAFSSLRRPAINGSADSNAVALPHSMMYSDVGRQRNAKELELTGWMVHDDDLFELAQCSWKKPKPKIGNNSLTSSAAQQKHHTEHHVGHLEEPVSPLSPTTSRTTARCLSSRRSSIQDTSRIDPKHVTAKGVHSISQLSVSAAVVEVPILTKLTIKDSPNLTLTGLENLNMGRPPVHSRSASYTMADMNPLGKPLTATSFNSLKHLGLIECSHILEPSPHAIHQHHQHGSGNGGTHHHHQDKSGDMTGRSALMTSRSSKGGPMATSRSAVSVGGEMEDQTGQQTARSTMPGVLAMPASLANVTEEKSAQARGTGKLLLRVFPALESIHLASISMPDATLTPLLNSLRNLKSLVITDSPCLNDDGLASITASITRRRCLTKLDISGSKHFSNEALLVLLQAGGGVLSDVNISKCPQIRDLGLMGLSARSHRTCLKILRMTDLLKTTSSGMGFLAEGIGRTPKEQQELRHANYLEKLKKLKKEALKDGAASQHLANSIISASSKLKSSSVIKYGKTKDDSEQSAKSSETVDVYASFSYGNSSKSKARRADARKGKQHHKPKRFGPDELYIDSWISLLDAGLSKLGNCGALGQLLVISMTKCVGITSAGVNFVLRGAPLLQKANFSGCHQVDDGIAQPFTFPAPMSADERRRKHEAEVAKGFDADGGGGEEGLEEEMCACRLTLVEIQLAGIPKISDRSLAIITAACPKLSSFIVSSDINALDMSRSTKVSHAAHEFMFSISSRDIVDTTTNTIGLNNNVSTPPSQFDGVEGSGSGVGGWKSGGNSTPTTPKSPIHSFDRPSVLKRSLSNVSNNSKTSNNVDGSGVTNLSMSMAASKIQFSKLIGRNHENMVSIGKLVTLDLSGAPRIDDDAMMVLFGGGSYHDHAKKPKVYLSNRDLYNASLLEDSYHNQNNSQNNNVAITMDGMNTFQSSSMSPSKYNPQSQNTYGYKGGSMALRHLKIKWCNSLSDAGMAAALEMAGRNCKQGLLLETLEAQGCPRLGDLTAIALAKLMQQQFRAGLGASSLKFLSVSGWAYLSDLGVCLLLQSLSRFDEDVEDDNDEDVNEVLNNAFKGHVYDDSLEELEHDDESQTTYENSHPNNDESPNEESVNKSKIVDGPGSKLIDTLDYVSKEVCCFSESMRLDHAIAQKRLWLLEYLKRDAENDKLLYDYQEYNAYDRGGGRNGRQGSNGGDDQYFVGNNNDDTLYHDDGTRYQRYEQEPLMPTLITNLPVTQQLTKRGGGGKIEKTPIISSTNSLENNLTISGIGIEGGGGENSNFEESSQSQINRSNTSLVKYVGFPQLSVLEDEEDLWYDWANSHLLKDRIKRDEGGGYAPTILKDSDVDKMKYLEKQNYLLLKNKILNKIQNKKLKEEKKKFKLKLKQERIEKKRKLEEERLKKIQQEKVKSKINYFTNNMPSSKKKKKVKNDDDDESDDSHDDDDDSEDSVRLERNEEEEKVQAEKKQAEEDEILKQQEQLEEEEEEDDDEEEEEEEEEDDEEETLEEKLLRKRLEAYCDQQSLISELKQEPRIHHFYREVFKMHSIKELSLLELYHEDDDKELENVGSGVSKPRLRRGRGFGLHGRFTVDHKPIPWFHFINGSVNPAVTSRLRCRLKRLEVTGCDWVGDTTITVLSQNCPATISHLDVKGLDELSEHSALALAQCRKLTHIDLRSTGVSDQACRLLANRLPYGQQNHAERMIEPRPEACANYNHYILERRYLHSAAVRIQMEARRWCSTMFVQREYEDQLWASPHCQRIARGFLARLKAHKRSKAGSIVRKFYQLAMIKHVCRVARKAAIQRAHDARVKLIMVTMVQCFARRCIAKIRMNRKRRRLKRILTNWENLTSRLIALRINQSVTSMVIKSQRIFRATRHARQTKKYEIGSLEMQRLFRGYKGRQRYAIVKEAKWRMMTAATIFVQRNRRRKVFWRKMKTRAIEAKELRELHLEKASQIHRWWRAMIMRLRFLRTMKVKKLEKESAVKIQALFRGHILRYNKACRKVKIIGNWGYFYTFVYHIKYKSEMASIIQRTYRAHIRVRVENRAIINIQRVFRGYMARKLKAILIFQRYDRCSRILQRMFRVWRARQIRKLVVATREAAAPVIQRCFRAWRFREYLRRMRARTSLARAKALEASKDELRLEKHRNMIESMVNRGREIAASKIQRQYRAYRARKKRDAQDRIKAEAEIRQKMARQERIDRMNDRKKAAKTLEGKTKKLVQNIGDRFTVKPKEIDLKKKMAEAKEKAGDMMGKAVKGAFTGRKHPKESQERDYQLEGAVMNHHTRTSVMQGIIDIHITVGSLDTANFQERNDERKLVKQPVWERIDKDLSGPQKKFVYLWFLRGEGRTVFTGMQVVLAPDEEERSNPKKVEQRLTSLRRSGTSVAGHASLSFEIQGLNTRSSGGSSPAVDEIAVSMSQELDLSLKSKGYDRLNPGFYKFDCGVKRQPIHLWIHVKKFKFERKANDLAKTVLSEYSWWTDGIGACVDKFALSVEAVADLHDKVFKALDFAEDPTEENDIEVCEWLDAIAEVRSKYFVYLLTCTGCEDTDQLNFTRYLNTVSTFCMFSKEELMRFLFGFCIQDDKVATYEKFDAMVAGILEFESSVFPAHKVDQTWHKFCTKRGDMFWEQFRTMLLSTPVLIWPIQRLQVKLAKQNLGEQFWLSQKQAMINARSRLGIRRDLS